DRERLAPVRVFRSGGPAEQSACPRPPSVIRWKARFRFEDRRLSMPRLFTALEIPREAALSLSLLRGGLPGARWVDVENYHLTLRFIGDVEGHVADEIANALDRIRRPAFTLTLSGVGAFG